MLVADAARCVLIATLLVLPPLRHHLPVGAQLAILYAVLAACSCFAEFFDPSRLAVIGAIVPEPQQSQASAMLSATASMAQILGPPIAAPLLITLGVQWALIVNAASFAVSFVCVRAINVPLESLLDEQPSEGFAAEFKTGLRFFVRNRVLMALGLGIVIAMLGNGAINSLAVFFVPHNLHVAASWLGTIIGAVGIGAVAGALLTGVISRHISPAQLFWVSLVICGIALISLSRAQTLGLAIGARPDRVRHRHPELGHLADDLEYHALEPARAGQRRAKPGSAARLDRVDGAGRRPGEHHLARIPRPLPWPGLRTVRHRFLRWRPAVRARRCRRDRAAAQARR